VHLSCTKIEKGENFSRPHLLIFLGICPIFYQYQQRYYFLHFNLVYLFKSLIFLKKNGHILFIEYALLKRSSTQL